MPQQNDPENLDVENEIDAIKAILSALAPLSPAVRNNVLEYVLKRLGIVNPSASVAGVDAPANEALQTAPRAEREQPAGGPIHIRQFKEQKQPHSANEMAAVVAYYLAHISPEKKKSINAKDIEDQFQIAGFPLPAQAKFTLTNARNAGYLDSAGAGAYQLNAVGHNLVAHSLPRGDKAAPKTRARKPRSQARRTRK